MSSQLKYLLDTNILSDLIRNPQGKIADQIRAKGEKTICTSIIVASELRFGAQKKNSQKLTNQVNLILSAVNILPLEEPVDRFYGEVRTELEVAGEVIGPNDLLIAAHCLNLDCVLVTANVREFKRVPKLIIENWLD